jgi:hypothetical protein
VKGCRNTQRDKLLELLRSRAGQWVSLPEILELGFAQFGARIFELRRLGFPILNRTERINGQKHSWYRLESTPRIEPTKTGPAGVVRVNTCSFPEFGTMAPEGRYPD